MKGNFLLQHAALTLCLLAFLNGKSQPGNETKYPQGYFGNPLNIRMELTANFGELRQGHWHMGLDLRTQQRENLPVFASADGYISHVGIRPLSFGKFIVIVHPNGYSTLYAHLNSFYPELQNYVRNIQKEKESWAIDLDFSPNDFKVKKGKEIAKSGNTGGSQGPHLHFEIRDTKTNKSLNTLQFGFNVPDNVAPTFSKLAIYDRSISTYLQSPQTVSVVKTKGGYLTKPGKIITGKKRLSFAITATDKVSGSNGPNGIYAARLFYDEAPQIEFLIDRMDYDESDYVNAHIDKRFRNAGGAYVQHLSVLPGFHGTVYEEMDGTGIIELDDTLVHNIRIEIFDANENSSTLHFQIQYNEELTTELKTPARLLIPNQVNIIEEKDFEAYMPEDCLYDSIPFRYDKQDVYPEGSVTAQHRFGDPIYPLHSAFAVRIKASKPVSDDLKNKLMILKEWKGARSVRKAEWKNGWITASFDNLGIFQAFVDTTAPSVTAPVKERDTLDLSRSGKIAFTPIDNFGIRSFRAELDGNWLMFSNDKGRTHTYIFDEQCPYGVHELKVRVEDLSGNITEKNWWFKRYPYTPPKKKVYKKKAPGKKPPVSKSGIKPRTPPKKK